MSCCLQAGTLHLDCGPEQIHDFAITPASKVTSASESAQAGQQGGPCCCQGVLCKASSVPAPTSAAAGHAFAAPPLRRSQLWPHIAQQLLQHAVICSGQLCKPHPTQAVPAAAPAQPSAPASSQDRSEHMHYTRCRMIYSAELTSSSSTSPAAAARHLSTAPQLASSEINHQDSHAGPTSSSSSSTSSSCWASQRRTSTCPEARCRKKLVVGPNSC